jgi:hypothetical protein
VYEKKGIRLEGSVLTGRNFIPTARYFTCLLVALCLSASMLYAKDPPKLSPAEQEVVDVSKARIDAASRQNTVAVARYFADDCLLSTDDGTLITKT